MHLSPHTALASSSLMASGSCSVTGKPCISIVLKGPASSQPSPLGLQPPWRLWAGKGHSLGSSGAVAATWEGAKAQKSKHSPASAPPQTGPAGLSSLLLGGD